MGVDHEHVYRLAPNRIFLFPTNTFILSNMLIKCQSVLDEAQGLPRNAVESKSKNESYGVAYIVYQLKIRSLKSAVNNTL